jgi:uncharacterized membrane protein
MKFLTGSFARILYAVPFIVFGINHFMYAGQMKNYVPSFFPLKTLLVYLTGLALIAAGVSIITKIRIRLASLLLAAMLFIFVLTMHIPGLFKEATMQMAMVAMLKDLGLAAAALMIAGTMEKK